MKDLSPALNEYRQIMEKADFRDFIIDLIDTFYDATTQHITQLKNAFHDKDDDAFKRAAHSLKSSGRTFNLAEFTAIAVKLESRGCREESNEIKDLIRGCELEFEKAKFTLEELRIELQGV